MKPPQIAALTPKNSKNFSILKKMRVIAGTFKSRILKAPKGTITRPTSDRLRESLFSILGPGLVRNSRVLDLFAGTGALGIEALSRGAAFAVFIDKAPEALRVLQENIENLGLQNKSRIIRWDIEKNLFCLKNESPFDLVFMDPPYSRGFTARTLLHLKKSGLLSETTRIVCEYTEKDDLLPSEGDFVVEDQRKYGKTLLARLVLQSPDELRKR